MNFDRRESSTNIGPRYRTWSRALPPDLRKSFAFPAATLSVERRGLCLALRAVEAEPLPNSKSTLTERPSLSAHQSAEPPVSQRERTGQTRDSRFSFGGSARRLVDSTCTNCRYSRAISVNKRSLA